MQVWRISSFRNELFNSRCGMKQFFLFHRYIINRWWNINCTFYSERLGYNTIWVINVWSHSSRQYKFYLVPNSGANHYSWRRTGFFHILSVLQKKESWSGDMSTDDKIDESIIISEAHRSKMKKYSPLKKMHNRYCSHVQGSLTHNCHGSIVSKWPLMRRQCLVEITSQ